MAEIFIAKKITDYRTFNIGVFTTLERAKEAVEIAYKTYDNRYTYEISITNINNIKYGLPVEKQILVYKGTVSGLELEVEQHWLIENTVEEQIAFKIFEKDPQIMDMIQDVCRN